MCRVQHATSSDRGDRFHRHSGRFAVVTRYPPPSGNELLAVFVVHRYGLDGTDPRRHLRVELGVLGNLPDEHALLRLAGAFEFRLAGVAVLGEGVPLVDALEHPGTGLPVVLDAHTRGCGRWGIALAAPDERDRPRGRRSYPRRDEPRGMVEGFEVIPAIDVQEGRVVQLVGGERGTGREYGDPAAAAGRWIDAGAETLHLIDLDGAFEGERANADAIEAIARTVDADVQVGGGIRTAADARALLASGVDRVILGTAAVENPDLVAEIAADYPEGVMVSLDAKGGEVVVEGWTEGTGLGPAEAATRYEDLGAAAILFTDVDIEGRLEGVRTEPVKAVVEAVEIPVVASGGVATIEDVLALREAGAAATVVGSALYEGRFTLAEARRALGG